MGLRTAYMGQLSRLEEEIADMAAEDAVSLLMIAKYFERIGDHAESVAYWTEYVVQGTRKGEPSVLDARK